MNKILVLLDGSKWSHKAAKHAKMLAEKKGDTEIVLFSVIDREEIRSTAFYYCKQNNSCSIIKDYEEKIQRDIRHDINEEVSEILLRFNKEGIKCSSRLAVGLREEEILKEVNSDDYLYIVMGAFGKKSNVKTGTLSGMIAKDVKIPMIIIH